MKRATVLALAALAVPLAQLGHAAVYAVRYGSAGGTLQASGAHAYFPGVLQAAEFGLGAVVLAGLCVLGVLRLLAAVASERPTVAGADLGRSFALLLAAQLAVFLVQENVEAALAGQQLAGVSSLLPGLIGQAPVALLAAAALSWLTTHIQTAAAAADPLLRRLRCRSSVAARTGWTPAPIVIPLIVWSAGTPRRGPPLELTTQL